MRGLPGFQCRQKVGFDLSLVPDEIIINHKHRSPPSQIKQGIQFLQNCADRFQPGFVAVNGPNIAEFAVEGTSPGILNGHGTIGGDIQKIKSRNRQIGNIRVWRFGIDRFRHPFFQVL